jgi:hypothetical protein
MGDTKWPYAFDYGEVAGGSRPQPGWGGEESGPRAASKVAADGLAASCGVASWHRRTGTAVLRVVLIRFGGFGVAVGAM